jgi:hypothetical protein
MNYTYEIYTTVDITPTGIVSNKYKHIKNYQLKRNQQRNYSTLIQVLSLRTNVDQPIVQEFLIDPADSHIFPCPDLPDQYKIWALRFKADRYQVFGEKNETAINDLHMVPIIPALTETTPIFPPYFITHGDLRNIYIPDRS